MLAAVAAGAVYQAVLLTGAGVSCIALLTPPEEALQGKKGRGRGHTYTLLLEKSLVGGGLFWSWEINSIVSTDVISD